MCIAGLDRRLGSPHQVSMQNIASWVTTQRDGDHPQINDLIQRGFANKRDVESILMARHAGTTFAGLAEEDSRIKSSIYATASLAVDPWLEPAVAHSAETDGRRFYNIDELHPNGPKMIDLDWLMSGNNTLYLAASQPQFERLSPVLGGLLASLKDTLHEWDIAGRKLDKPLLIVIDEAGQLELGWLPAEVSTIAALGAFFVTCWQSLAQVKHRYSTQSDAVLSGHRTKCFFAGIDDLDTVNYLKGLLGSEHVHRRSWSTDIPSMLSDDRGRRSTTDSMNPEEFAPANALRQMEPGEAVLLHGTLPPVHLAAFRWWLEPDLADILQPDTAAPEATCPLGTGPAIAKPLIPPSALDEARSLTNATPTKPAPAPPPTGQRPTRPATSSGPGRAQAGQDQMVLDLDTDPNPAPGGGGPAVPPPAVAAGQQSPSSTAASATVGDVVDLDRARGRGQRCHQCNRRVDRRSTTTTLDEATGEVQLFCDERCRNTYQGANT